MVAELSAIATLMLAGLAEWLHYRRCRVLGNLAFGPSGQPHAWTSVIPFLRILGLTALAWALVTLLLINPKVFQQEELPKDQYRRVVVVLDVSPSMKLADAGQDSKMKRSERASEVLTSIFSRIAADQAMFSVIAVYSGARPVVIDTGDMEVVRNIMDDLPMEYAFKHGKTQLIEGVREAALLAEKWPADSTTVLIVSDGDTMPDTGMPEMPLSVAKVLVIGVGNPKRGIFIDGHQSRQDTAELSQLARRLGGEYYDANVKHLPSEAIAFLAESIPLDSQRGIGKRELALFIMIIASSVLALVPLALQVAGSHWHRVIRKSKVRGQNAAAC